MQIYKNIRHPKLPKPLLPYFIGSFVVLILLAFATSDTWLPWPGEALVEDSESQNDADALILLMGSPLARTIQTASLFHQGKSPRIIFVKSRLGDLEEMGIRKDEVYVTKELLKLFNVPEEKIYVINDLTASSTIEEALILREKLPKIIPNPKRYILVTSWYHTSRAAWIFRKVFANQNVKIEVSPATEKDVSAHFWWTSEDGLISVYLEYLKWLYYLLQYSWIDFNESQPVLSQTTH